MKNKTRALRSAWRYFRETCKPVEGSLERLEELETPSDFYDLQKWIGVLASAVCMMNAEVGALAATVAAEREKANGEAKG